MNDIEYAKELLREEENTCVLYKKGAVYISKAKGIAPMLQFIESSTDLKDFSCADKVVGKAAAMLFALAGVKEVYAEVLSSEALPVFFKYSIKFSYAALADKILNRDGTASCPMEESVKNIDDFNTAYGILKQKLASLKNKETV